MFTDSFWSEYLDKQHLGSTNSVKHNIQQLQHENHSLIPKNVHHKFMSTFLLLIYFTLHPLQWLPLNIQVMQTSLK